MKAKPLIEIHLSKLIIPDALEEAVEELYANYDGSTWKLEDSLPA